MTTKKIKALIVSLPGIFQRMLAKRIGFRSEFEVMGIANGGLSASTILKKHQLDLVVIGSDIPEDEVLELIKVIEQDYPDLYYLVVRNTSREVQEMKRSGNHQSIRGLDLDARLDDLVDDLMARVN